MLAPKAYLRIVLSSTILLGAMLSAPLAQALDRETSNGGGNALSSALSSWSIALALLDAELRPMELSIQEYRGEGALPRHELQKAREVFTKAQTLRFLYGLERRPLPTMQVKQVESADVGRMVAEIELSLEALLPIFSVAKADTTELQRQEVSVYAILSALSIAIDQLGVPSILPNDNFQMAMAIESQAAGLYQDLRGLAPDVKDPRIRGKKSYHVLDEAQSLLALLQNAETELGLPAPGSGTGIPQIEDQDAGADTVMNALNILLAEVTARRHVQDGLQIVIPEASTGKTPSEVFASLVRTGEILNGLKLEESGAN